MVIRLVNISKAYGSQLVLDGFHLDLAPNSVTALMGPNGSGKTTIGHILLGLIASDAGHVVGSAGLRRAALFQEDRLCPQLTAAANVGLVLKPNEAEALDLNSELGSVGLDHTALAKPVRELSGGQRRRVAIVRALLPDADLLVLDEPFAALDTASKPSVRAWAKGRLDGRTTLMITHDEADVAALADSVVYLG